MSKSESGLLLLEPGDVDEYPVKNAKRGLSKTALRRSVCLLVVIVLLLASILTLHSLFRLCHSNITIIDIETPTHVLPENTISQQGPDSGNQNTVLSAIPGASPTESKTLIEELDSLVFKNYGAVRKTDKFVWNQHPCHYLEAHNVTGPYRGWAEVGTCTYMFQEIGNEQFNPPSGMRSSVPLGGVSTGSFELRADGKFHEWTIFNQHPAGAAKIQFMEDMFMGVRAQVNEEGGATVTRVLQTTPSLDELPAVESLIYRGSYPVSKLTVEDPDLPIDVTVYAYSRYKYGDLNTSALPAVAFTAVLHNPSSTESYNASFMINLPIGIEQLTQRVDVQMPKFVPLDPSTPDTLYYSDIRANLTHPGKIQSRLFKSEDLLGLNPVTECFQQCTDDCYTWTYDEAGEVCYTHFDHARMNGYKEGFYAGVKTDWRREGECLTVNRPTPGYSTNGNLSLCAFSSDKNFTYSLGADNDVLTLWDEFSNGRITSKPKGHQVSGAVAGHVTLLPGERKEVTLVLGWYFPDRDFLGIPIGNFYEHLVKDSKDAATKLGKNLQPALEDIYKLHSIYFNSDVPETIQDMLVNSLSHIRSAFWTKDGRWRQWEAYDCVNMDSIHNDGERHLPYMMIFPETVVNKLYAWAAYQQSDGMLNEELRCGCWNFPITPIEMEFGCGRVMSDVSSMFIVYLLELHQWHLNSARVHQVLTDLWPNAKRAAQWHLDRANDTGLPQYLVTTYDVLGLAAYPYSSYSSAFHLLAMKAAEKLALVMGDDAFAAQCEEAFVRGQLKMDELLWNSTAQYYNAYTTAEGEFDESSFFTDDLGVNLCSYPEYQREEWGECVEGWPTTPGAIMTDTFYAQVLAYTLGLGTLVRDEDRLRKHMMAELRHNDSPFGMLVLTGRFPYPGPYTDNAVWMMGNGNWATIALHLGMDYSLAMDVATKVLDIWRDTLHDTWNVAGILGGYGYGADGLPFITSHYGYYMSSWHIAPALSGQHVDVKNKNITFSPKIPPPFKLPVMLPTFWGLLEAQVAPLDSSNSTQDPGANINPLPYVYYNLTVHFGELNSRHLAHLGVEDCHLDVTEGLYSVGSSLLWKCSY